MAALSPSYSCSACCSSSSLAPMVPPSSRVRVDSAPPETPEQAFRETPDALLLEKPPGRGVAWRCEETRAQKILASRVREWARFPPWRRQ